MSRKGNCLDNAPMEIYMDASRLQGMIWCVRTTGCSSISGLFVQDFCLLAPMEFADPRLILLKGFSPSEGLFAQLSMQA